ncbi:DNA cytosine methyltransferase [Streptomyces sp. NBC_00358]|jgi:Site-specific DNA methylase|uniref:DNA cytosine methyltransferase n=1 Tax=Streptomyces sp. NBC_00358 TaxID=2975725 RepID=UPI002E2572E1
MSALRIGSVCTGYGGLDQAVQEVFRGELAWLADNDPGAALILAHHHPSVPNLGDITALDWRDVEPVDVLTGGYPCQPFSTAGKREGTKDARHLWPYIARALGVLRPRYAIFENVANHLRIGFDTVLCDLADLGFDVEWCVVRADEVGAPHRRKRLFLLVAAADAADLGHERSGSARRRGNGPADHRQPVADAERLVSRDDGELPAGRDALQQRVRDDAPRCGAPAAADTDGIGRGTGEHGVRAGQSDLAWGRFGPAIARWEAATDRRAPWATDDRGRLSPAFVEWMMGLDPGHVTAVPGLSRTAQLKALGNGVVPPQAVAALHLLLSRTEPATWGRAAA